MRIRYETGLAILLGMFFSIVLFDRGAIAVLSPFIVDDLGLTNTQFGLAAGGLAVTWAASSFLVGRWSDRVGRRKPFLLAAAVLFSLASMASGLAGGFVSLLLLRLLMGLAEGPTPTLNFALIFDASQPSRIGFNTGLYNLAAGLFGLILSPVVLVAWAEQFGWRSAFVFAGVPGLIMAVLIAFFVREERPLPGRTQERADAAGRRPAPLLNTLRQPNVLACVGVSALSFGGIGSTIAFLPLYMTKELGKSPQEAAVLSLVYSVLAIALSMIGPALSDRFGRKPITTIGMAAGVLMPLGCLLYPQPVAFGVLGLSMLVGLVGGLPLITIPGESVAPADRGVAMGIVVGLGEVLGVFGVSAAAGVAADRWGLATPFWIAAGCLAGAAALSLLLRETAPRRVQADEPSPSSALKDGKPVQVSA